MAGKRVTRARSRALVQDPAHALFRFRPSAHPKPQPRKGTRSCSAHNETTQETLDPSFSLTGAYNG
jgi:hypothetical protein